MGDSAPNSPGLYTTGLNLHSTGEVTHPRTYTEQLAATRMVMRHGGAHMALIMDALFEPTQDRPQ